MIGQQRNCLLGILIFVWCDSTLDVGHARHDIATSEVG